MNTDFLAHHGVIGQKWGVRRYQYQDGSLTPEGLKRYSRGDVHRIKREFRKEAYKENREQGMGVIKSYMNAGKEAAQKTIEVVGKQRYNQVKAQDTAIGVGSALVAAALSTYFVASNEARKSEYKKQWNSNWDSAWYNFSKQYAGNDDIAKTVSKTWAEEFRNIPSKDLQKAWKDKYGGYIPESMVDVKKNLESNMRFSFSSPKILKELKRQNKQS